MYIVLLSGGSGKRLWPLSNDLCSKQYIKLMNHDEEQENREKYAAKMAAAGFDVQAQAERMMRFYESGRWENE